MSKKIEVYVVTSRYGFCDSEVCAVFYDKKSAIKYKRWIENNLASMSDEDELQYVRIKKEEVRFGCDYK